MRRQPPGGVPAGGAFGPGRAMNDPGAAGPPKVTRPAVETGGTVEARGAGAGAFGLPSAKLRATLASPFAKPSDGKTPFAAQYAAGGIPCRINHGTVKHSLVWTYPPETLPFDPLLLLCAEGLRETVHPHTFVAPAAFAELVASPGAYEKLLPLLPRLMPPLRAALGSPNAACVAAALTAIAQLVATAGEALMAHVAPLLVQINKHDTNRVLRDAVRNTLTQLEVLGGPNAGAIIRSKLPAYGR